MVEWWWWFWSEAEGIGPESNGHWEFTPGPRLAVVSTPVFNQLEAFFSGLSTSSEPNLDTFLNWIVFAVSSF